MTAPTSAEAAIEVLKADVPTLHRIIRACSEAGIYSNDGALFDGAMASCYTLSSVDIAIFKLITEAHA